MEKPEEFEPEEFDEQLIKEVRKALGREDVQLTTFKKYDDYKRILFNLKELWIPDYSLATNFGITNLTYGFAGKEGIHRINFFFPVEVPEKILGDLRVQNYNCNVKVNVYCRHKEWGRDNNHTALEGVMCGPYSSRSMWTGDKTWYDFKIRHGLSLDKLIKFYTKQGVKPGLVDIMREEVSRLREQNPERTEEW